jgi:hypothetical protein
MLETPVKASPAVKDGRLFIATTTKNSEPARLHAFSEFSGTKVWNYSFGLSKVVSTPAVAAGRVIIGCGGGGGGGAAPGVYAFNELSGVPAWDFVTSGPVTSSPAIDEEESFVAVCCQNGFVYTRSLTDGTPMGSVLLNPNESSPAISDEGYVYVSSADENLYRLNKWCDVIDSYDTNSKYYDISSPALLENHLIIGHWDILTVYCFGSPWPEHDVAVLDVHPQQTGVVQGDPVTIEYTVKNEGNVAEDITVNVGYRNSTVPPFGDVTSLYNDTFALDVGAQTTRYYVWDTTGIPPDAYNTCAIVHYINGETDVADNLLVNGSVTVVLPGLHDVAVTAVTPAKTVVCQSMSMKIRVEVTNLGAFLETFHVTVKAIPSLGLPVTVGIQLVSLAPAETRVLTFIWLTSGVPVNAYTIEATAETVPGETYTINNIHTDGQVKVSTMGDLNADNVVDIGDAAQVGISWMQTVPPANPNVDINDDGIIDISDAAIIGVHWMHTYP